MSAAALLVLAVAFAFPDAQGTRLLATGMIAEPEALRTALCTGGQQVPVLFEQRRADRALFRIAAGSVGPGATCVLADESFFSGATLVPLKRPPQDARCSKAKYPDFQADKGRPVVACWPIAESAAGVQIAIIEFSRRLNQALASLVVIDGERRMYIDYAADFTGPGADLWRAGDGGEIHAEGFEVVFLLKRAPTYLLAIDWSGAEGNALSLHSAEGPGQFKELTTDSW